jgi:hypothetical protein
MKNIEKTVEKGHNSGYNENSGNKSAQCGYTINESKKPGVAGFSTVF